MGEAYVNEDTSETAISLNLSGATVCFSEIENSIDLSEDESLTLPDPVIPPNSQFNIDRSNDVIVGQVTQIYGPVTIFPNSNSDTNEIKNESQKYLAYDSTKTNSASASADASEEKQGSKKSSKNCYSKCSIYKIIIITFIALAALGLILFGIFYTLGMYVSNENNKPSPTERPQTSPPAPGSRHKFIYRDRWGGRKPLYERPQKLPVKYVVISHSAGKFCQNIKDCSEQMALMQSMHVSDLGSPDIGYNFVIGGDENIYVGRNWQNHNFHMNLDTIGICFMGNFIFDRLTPGMIEAAQYLLKIGVDGGKLEKDYIIVAHNQTYNTQSPGTNVFNQIKYWPHYSPDLLTDIEDIPHVTTDNS